MELICKICGYEANSRQGFNSHITHSHNIKSKEYYDTYLKQINDGICPSCGKETTFRNMWYGYNKHCSTKCIPLDPDIQNKMKQTCQNRYGTDYAFQSNQVKNKIKQTTRVHYGVDCYLQTKECRDIIAEYSRSKENKDKIKQTIYSHYGVNCSFQADSVKNKIQQTLMNRYGVSNAGHFNVNNKYRNDGVRSSYEKLLKDALLDNNIEFIYEYNKDIRYPYLCDFYLPEKDIFVEINGYWTHGKHWFDCNSIDDIALFNSIKQKAIIDSKYKSMLYTWIYSDIEKRNKAKQNKLNYVVLWNKQDIKDWIDSNFEIRHDY